MKKLEQIQFFVAFAVHSLSFCIPHLSIALSSRSFFRMHSTRKARYIVNKWIRWTRRKRNGTVQRKKWQGPRKAHEKRDRIITQRIKRAARTMHKKEADPKQILGYMGIKAFVIPLIICYENAAAERMLDCRAIKQDLETTRSTRYTWRRHRLTARSGRLPSHYLRDQPSFLSHYTRSVRKVSDVWWKKKKLA